MISRLKAQLKLILYSWKKFLSRLWKAIVLCVGHLFLFYKVVELLDKDVAAIVNQFVSNILVLTLFTIILIIWSLPRLSFNSRIDGQDTKIEIRICDILEQSGPIVVSYTTTFDTDTNENVISPKSLQGKFQEHFFNSKECLDEAIESSLADVDYEQLNCQEKPYGKGKRYPIGTVASVRKKDGQQAHLVAIANLNKNKIAKSEDDDVLDCLPKLWNSIREDPSLSTENPLYVPLIGTGLARTTLRREQIVREIAKSFVVATFEGRFCEHLVIVIFPDDAIRNNVDFANLERYLEHLCAYPKDVHPKMDDGRPNLNSRPAEPIL